MLLDSKLFHPSVHGAGIDTQTLGGSRDIAVRFTERPLENPTFRSLNKGLKGIAFFVFDGTRLLQDALGAHRGRCGLNG